MTHATADSIAAIAAEAPYQARQKLHIPLWRRLADRWQRNMDRQLAASVSALDHPGVAADFERAVRQG
jgi:hypothetical protein